jgi:hypothetical protein
MNVSVIYVSHTLTHTHIYIYIYIYIYIFLGGVSTQRKENLFLIKAEAFHINLIQFGIKKNYVVCWVNESYKESFISFA